MLYNIHRDAKMDPHGKDWDDFFSEWKEPLKDQTEDQMFQTMMMLAKATEVLPA